MARSAFFSKKYTIGDTGAPLETMETNLINCDMQILTNAVDVGDFSNQDFELAVGDIDSYVTQIPINLAEYFVKNHVGAAVGYIVVKGIQV